MSRPDSLPVGPFNEGLNTLDPPGSLRKTQLALCQNWNLDPFGILIKRFGSSFYGSSPAKLSGDNAIKFLRRYYKTSGTKELIGIANGIISKGNDGTGAWTPIAPPAAWTGSTSRLHDSFIYKNRLYILGGSYPTRYNGTDLLATGHFQHVAAGWSAAQVAGLIPDGTYKYMITEVQGDLGEGGYTAGTGEKSVVVAGGPRQVNFTVLDVAPAAVGGTFKQVWRTKIGGTLYYKLPDGLISTGATTYNDNNIDGSLTELYIQVTAPPTDATFAVVGADDRVYYFGMGSGNESVCQVSDVGFPDRIVSNLFFSISAGDGHPITGAGLVQNGIVFFKQDSMWLWQGVGFGLIVLKPKLGCRARFSIVQLPDGINFLSQYGETYFYDGVNLENIGRGVKNEFDGQTASSSSNIVAAYDPIALKYLIAYDYKVLAGYNTRVLEYDLTGKKWDGPHLNNNNYNVSYFSIWDSLDDQGEVYWGEALAANGSYVYKKNLTKFVDRFGLSTLNLGLGLGLGASYESVARTGVYFFESIGEKKFFKVFGRAKISSGTKIQVRIYGDDESSYSYAELFIAQLVGTNDLIWNTGLWGTNNWGGQVIAVAEDTYPPSARGRRPTIEIRDLSATTLTKIESLDILTLTLTPK
jgi:hypothetical protein